MNTTKRTCSVFSGLLLIAICAFEISETARFITMIVNGNGEYIGELIIKFIYMAALVSTGIFFIVGKAGKKSAITLTIAGGVALYKTVSYVIGILGNEMIFGIVYGNIVDMLEIVLFIVPAAVLLLCKEKNNKKALNVGLIATVAAAVIGISGRIASFLGWGKSFATDFTLFFDVYALDLLRTIVFLCAFALAILSLAPEKRKNRK